MANKYEQLESTLKDTFQKEWEGLTMTDPRMFFSDAMDKGSYQELLAEFEADPHDSEWSKLVQDEHGDFSKIATHARAIGYMDSMWRELQQHYLVNEINSVDEEKSLIGKWLEQDPEILKFLTPES